MKTRYTHVVWDWNGTILDDTGLCVEIVNGLLAARGKPSLTLEGYLSIFRFPVRDYYVDAGFDFTSETFEKVGKEWMDEYERRKAECSPRVGVIEVIRGLHARGLGQSLLSAYSQTALAGMAGSYGLKSYFTHIRGLDNIYAPGKVELGRKLMSDLGGIGSSVLMVGDTGHDLEVARAMGADCVLLAGGHQSLSGLKALGARVCERPEEILAAIE